MWICFSCDWQNETFLCIELWSVSQFSSYSWNKPTHKDDNNHLLLPLVRQFLLGNEMVFLPRMVVIFAQFLPLSKMIHCFSSNYFRILILYKWKYRYSPVLCSWSTNNHPLIFDFSYFFLILAPGSNSAGP